MQLNWLALAVPFFLLFMWLEYRYSLKKRQPVHHWNETIANLNVGIAERLTDLICTGLFYFFFEWIYRHWAIFHIEAHGYTWLFLFLTTDLAWYWYHRFGHEVNLFWAVHVVHHQSDDFNYTVSARITVLQAAARCLFWSVLPLVGFPPHMIAILLLIHGAYPFFTHTQLIGKLGWLEYILVTPSHHRVHHSSNPEYLDKNYGDMLIIWDKLFGTFAKEEAPPVYGLTKPLQAYSFLWQHFHFMLEMAVAFRRASGFREKCRVILGKPDAIDPRIRPYLEKKLASRNKQWSEPGEALIQVINLQTGITLTALFLLLLFAAYLSAAQLWLGSLFILLSVISTGAMIEQRRWIFHLDYIRFILLGANVYAYFPHPWILSTVVLALVMVLSFYRSIRSQYNHYLYQAPLRHW